LYPSLSRGTHGIFVEHRLRKLVATGRIESTVVCPVPWFFSTNNVFGQYARMAATPKSDVLHAIPVHYPRFPLLPKVGMYLAPGSMFRSTYPLVASLHREKRFSAIDAHYFYPDGVAAIMLGDALDLPVVITARGTDINLIPQYERARRKILWAAGKARHIVTVCQALKDELVGLGACAKKISVLRNGVDLELFRPVDRELARVRHGFTRRTLVSVGHLVPRKGHDIAVRALFALPDVDLFIAGNGPERARLERLAIEVGVADRVRFLGEVTQQELAEIYTAADAMVLASSREGWANVLLEAMACGTPVIASNVWGTPEVVDAPETGVLMNERTPEGLVGAYHRLFASLPRRADTRRYAERFSWDQTTQGQLEIFDAIRRTPTAA
jgi:glycosyltransferase involved in cell wall biosynthesis